MTEETENPPEGEGHAPQWQYQFIDLTKIEAGEFIAPAKLAGPMAQEFADLNTISADLEFALSCFRSAAKLGAPDPEDAMAMALIFSGVVSYARPFKTGVRLTRLDAAYFASLPQFSAELHDYIIAVRDKHVAHSVNDLERCEATAVMVGMPNTKWRAAGIGFTIMRSIGLSLRIIEAAITQIEVMRAHIASRVDEIRLQLFADFREAFEKDGKWEAAPIATFPDRSQVSKRRT